MSAISPDRLLARERTPLRRLRWLLAIGGALIALAAAYVHFYTLLAAGERARGTAR